MRYRRIVVCVLVIFGVALGSAWAQVAVTDPATTAQNAVIAVLKNQIVLGKFVQYAEEHGYMPFRPQLRDLFAPVGN